MEEIVRQLVTCDLIDNAHRLCQNKLYGFCPHKGTYQSLLETLIMESSCDLENEDGVRQTKGKLIDNQISRA